MSLASEQRIVSTAKPTGAPFWLIPLALAGILGLAQSYYHPLFHFLAEVFNTTIMILVVVVGWQAYSFSRNGYLAHIASGYFWVAALNIAHAVTYTGMNIVPGEWANASLQFWLGAIVLESILLASAPFADRLGRVKTFAIYGLAALVLSAAVLAGAFPIAFVPGVGQTAFKLWTEYLVILLLLAGLATLRYRRHQFDRQMVQQMSWAILLIAAAEVAFTNYREFGEWQTIAGHALRFAAYWVIYLAVVRTALTKPFHMLADGTETFAASPDPTVVVDERGVIRRVNRAARAFFGGDDAGFIGIDCHKLLHSDVSRSECPVCRQLALGLPATDIEVDLRDRGQWHHVSLAPILVGHRAAGTVHVNRDITRQKRLEKALRESEARYRGLIETTTDWVWEVDENLVFTYVSPQTREILGYEPQELLGKTVFDFMHPVDADELSGFAELVIADRRIFRGRETIVRRKDGVPVILETGGAPYFEEGEFRGYRGISRDASARKEIEQALSRSEQTYRTLVDNLPMYVFLKDTESRLVSCNRNFARLLGRDINELQGQPMSAFHSQEMADRFRREDIQVIESGELQEFDAVFLLNGETRNIHQVKTPVKDANGRVIGILGIFWDVTEKIQAENALRESQWLYQAILQSACDAIIVGDATGKFIDCNKRAEELFGYSRDELLQMRVAQIHAPENQEKMTAAFRQMNEKGYSLFEHRMLKKDGTVFDVEASGTRIAHGDTHIYLGNFRDIGNRKRVEHELSNYRNDLELLVEERTRELRVMNRELEAFSYSVSHDLRSPLRAINGFGEALREELADQLSQEAHVYLDRMRAATIRMGELIDGLLNLAQVIRSQLRFDHVDLSGLAKGLATALAESDDERSVRFVIDGGLAAVGDRTLLQVLLENLFNNAWKFTARRQDACIEFGRAGPEKAMAFYVRDNGAGFDMQFAHKLFQPFERLHAHGEFDGTGIGLATVRRIVERHGGKVWAEGDPGQGACIYFTLDAK